MKRKRETLHFDTNPEDNEACDLAQEDERFAQVVEYGLKYAVAVEVLAEMCCQSISTFKRHFRARYSIPPHRWFILRKLELAYTIILERDVTVVELTKLCGFNNTSHFISAFRKRYDISPARLRKQVREEEQRGHEAHVAKSNK